MGHICTSSLGACGDINLVFGLEAKMGGGVGPEKNQHYLAWQLLQGGLFQFPWPMQGSSLRRGGEVASMGGAEAVPNVKEISSKLGGHRPQLHQCLPTCTHPSFQEPIPYQSIYSVEQ